MNKALLRRIERLEIARRGAPRRDTAVPTGPELVLHQIETDGLEAVVLASYRGTRRERPGTTGRVSSDEEQGEEGHDARHA